MGAMTTISDMNDPYRAIATWYDLEHDSVTDDIECYIALIREHAQARASVLEIGAGTGRIAAALALAGFVVTGVEPSTAMLARAARRLEGLPERVARRVHMVRGTAAAPNLAPEERFDVALYGLNTFAHLLTIADWHAALVATAHHIAPGGHMIVDLDLAGPRALAQHLGLLWWQGSWPVVEGAAVGSEVAHFVIAAQGREPGTLEVVHLYDVVSSDGTVRRTTARMPLAVISAGELQMSLAWAGFQVNAAYGSHDLAAYEGDAPRFVVVASAHKEQDAEH
jgi:SAM-dependent methyltransferase